MDNLWGTIAKARGVELNEEFEWFGLRYKVTDYDGLLVLKDRWEMSNSVISFIKGEGVIKKLPFRPKIAETYYSIIHNASTISFKWANTTADYERLIAGIVFRTREEAEDYLPIWQERISKL